MRTDNDISPSVNEELPFCECGCGLRVKRKGNRFIYHHNSVKKGSYHNEKWCDAIRNGARKEKEPLPGGQSILIPKNKNSPQYLGCIAEELLALTFKDVRRMSPGNRGFDLICNQNFKIDIKSSATGYKGHWLFAVKKNTIADYFLCIAFESRDDLTPVHVWLIPGKDVNHLTGIWIAKSTITKWSKYEQSLERVLACCDVMGNKEGRVIA